MKLIIFILFLIPLSSWGFNLGPYVLGMTNASAAKIGIYRCKELYTSIGCDGYVELKKQQEIVTLEFDQKTKRLTKIQAFFFTPNGIEDLPSILEELKIKPCPEDDLDVKIYTCFKRNVGFMKIAPVAPPMRRSGYFQRQYKFTLEASLGSAKIFYDTKLFEYNKSAKVKRFQEGK